MDSCFYCSKDPCPLLNYEDKEEPAGEKFRIRRESEPPVKPFFVFPKQIHCLWSSFRFLDEQKKKALSFIPAFVEYHGGVEFDVIVQALVDRGIYDWFARQIILDLLHNKVLDLEKKQRSSWVRIRVPEKEKAAIK